MITSFNTLFVPYNTETIRLAYKSEYNHRRKNQVILLMITDGKKQHYLAVRNLSALLREKSSNHHGGFYCLNCFYSYSTKNRLKKHEELCNKQDFCRIEMPKSVEKILKYNSGEKSLKVSFVIYLDLECLPKKEQSHQNNPEELYTEKKAKHEPSGWAMFTTCSFDVTENKLDYYRARDCIKKFCEKLKDHALKIINYKKKKRNDTTN